MPDDNNVDKKVVGKAYKVEISPGGFLPIKSYRGGDPVAERAEASSGSSREGEATPGHKALSELSLTVFISPGNKVLAEAAHRVANQGQNERFTITINELAKDKSVVKTFVYYECLFTGLDYPRLSSQGGEILSETATFKPERLEVS